MVGVCSRSYVCAEDGIRNVVVIRDWLHPVFPYLWGQRKRVAYNFITVPVIVAIWAVLTSVILLELVVCATILRDVL